MKNNRFILILFIIAVGMFLTGFQLFTNHHLLYLFVLGIIFVGIAVQLKNRFIRTNGLFFGILMILLSVFSTWGIWLAGSILIVYGLSYGRKLIKKYLSDDSEWIWKKKKYVSVKLKEPSDRFETQRQEWIGVQKIGKDTFEWDDINISHLMGDTIIDLGNTVLPNEQNTIMIRKGIGRIRVIVPIGVGVKLSHNAFIGEVKFDGQQLELKNETITMYSERFESSHKKINIISSVLVGEIEVIEA